MAYISVVKLEKLFFRCHKILPLAYDESLSYYEVLCKVANSINEVIEATNNLNDNVTDLNGRCNTMQEEIEDIANEINTFESEINAKFDELEDEFGIKFDQLESNVNAYVESKMNEVDSKVAELEATVNGFVNLLETRLQEFEANLTQLVNTEFALIDAKFDSLEDNLKAYIYNELQKVLEAIPEITTVWVTNPVTGEYAEVQTVLNDFYDVLRYWALTADEFDALGMTCEELEHISVNGVPRGLTCLEWDMYAKLFINTEPDKDKVGSYLTGELVTLEDNVNINNMLLKESGCYECEEWDTVGKDADAIDALGISAYRWDWFSNNDYVA
jgi:predicted nuclease with TOPRIM domain